MSAVSGKLNSNVGELSAREIWDRAQTVSKTAAYTAENNSGEVKVKIVQKAYADGTIFQRSDYHSTLGDSTCLQFPDCEYHIYHPCRKMIKQTYRHSWVPDFSGDAEYYVRSETLNGIDCYVVTQEIEPTPEVVEKLYAAIPDFILKRIPDAKQSILHNAFPARTREYIGKDDFFTYSIESFLLSGERKSRYLYTNVRLNPAIDDDQFQIPEGYGQEIADTYEQFTDLDKVIVDQLIYGEIAPSPQP